MTVGTPGFQGWRLEEARKARCLSVIALSEIIGVSPVSIYQFQNGDTTPSEDTLTKIGAALNLPNSYFRKKGLKNRKANLFLRSFASATKRAQRRVHVRYLWLEEIVDFLFRYIEIPKLNLPRFDSSDPRQIQLVDIEGIANETRRFWGLGNGPISNVAWLLEANGVLVSRMEMGVSNLDALSGWSPNLNIPIVVLGTDKASACRQRFDAAHELAHLLLHRNLDSELVRDDPDFFHLIEGQAHRFAGAFLFPESSFKREIFMCRLDEFTAVKPKWKTSIQMMLRRCRDLNLISEDRYGNLFKSLSRKGWKQREPFDDALPEEIPNLLRDSVMSIVENAIMSKHEIESELSLSPNDIEGLCGLDRGFFTEEAQRATVIDEWRNREYDVAEEAD